MGNQEDFQLRQSQTDEATEAEQLRLELEAIATRVKTTAQQHQGESLELLALLRLLETLHREIRDELFLKSLPDNRQALYNLLKDIEAQGGWPYIHRMKLQEFLADWLTNSVEEDSSAPR